MIESADSRVVERQGIYFGWKVVAAAFFISAATLGSFYSYGVFLLPMITEFGWSRALFSGVSLTAGLTYALIVPWTGMLADRLGYRKVTTATAIILGLGFVLCGRLESIWAFYFLGGFLAGVGGPTAVALPLAIVARWFTRRQGLALGLSSAGIGIGAAAVPLLMGYMIEEFGWRTAFTFLGVMIWVICVPGALLTMKNPDPDYVLAYEGEVKSSGVEIPGSISEDYTLSRALGVSAFWFLFIVFALCIFGLGLIMTHIVPYARDAGLSAMTAASLLSFMGVFSIIGRIASGTASDKIGARPVFAVCLGLQGGLLFWLIKVDSTWSFILFSMVFGFSYGGNIVLVPKLAAEIFGPTHIGSIFGGLSVADGLGFGFGPLLAGYLFDRTGSYDISFMIIAAGFGLAVLLMLILKDRSVTVNGSTNEQSLTR